MFRVLVLSKQCRLYELCNMKISVAAARRVLSDMAYKYKGAGLYCVHGCDGLFGMARGDQAYTTASEDGPRIPCL